MKDKLIAMLGLKPDATEDQILAAIAELGSERDLLKTENANLKEALVAKIGKRESAAIEAAIGEKMRAGLTREQAIEVIAAQAAEDIAKDSK